MELKPCPFCGSEAIHNSIETERINCSNPGCYQSDEWRKFGQYIVMWNTRPLEDALQRKLDIAVDKLRSASKLLEALRLESGVGDILTTPVKDLYRSIEEDIINALRKLGEGE